MELLEQTLNGTENGVVAAEESATYRRQLVMLRRSFGPIVMRELENPRTQDICLNQDTKLWVQRQGEPFQHVGNLHPVHALSALATIATMRKTRVDHEKPDLETNLPLDGSRIEGIVPPVVTNPIFAIRKRTAHKPRLEHYEESGILTDKNDPRNNYRNKDLFLEMAKDKSHGEIIRLAIKEKKNIVVVGSTGSGKTTLVNAVLEMQARLAPHDRTIVIEDTPELVCEVDNHLSLLTTDSFNALSCLKASMRLTPSRIVMGEVRDKAAHAMLKAWTTGHPGGLATFHANDARGGLGRLESLVAESPEAKDLDKKALIAEAVDLVVFIDKDVTHPAGRKVREVLAVTGFDSDYITHRL